MKTWVKGSRGSLLEGGTDFTSMPPEESASHHDSENHHFSSFLTSFGSSDDQVAHVAQQMETWDFKNRLGALPLAEGEGCEALSSRGT